LLAVIFFEKKTAVEIHDYWVKMPRERIDSFHSCYNTSLKLLILVYLHHPRVESPLNDETVYLPFQTPRTSLILVVSISGKRSFKDPFLGTYIKPKVAHSPNLDNSNANIGFGQY
jgi:hypothetical protein